ncbi:MAG: hypothetical protein JWP69_361 [Flaviaesturariibacter sp.]|nr:hypothetical protein [Flaviaesturariibacter sp.]
MEPYPSTHTAEQEDIFAGFENTIEQAGSGKRLANYLIDLISFYAIFFIIGMIWAIISPETIEELDTESTGFNLLDRLLGLVLYGLYMFVIEALFKGKSLGKLITGTRAVNEDGSTISTKTALLRGLSRMVPFNAFSALGAPPYPWHDRWTNTYVIDEKRSGVVSQ